MLFQETAKGLKKSEEFAIAMEAQSKTLTDKENAYYRDPFISVFVKGDIERRRSKYDAQIVKQAYECI